MRLAIFWVKGHDADGGTCVRQKVDGAGTGHAHQDGAFINVDSVDF